MLDTERQYFDEHREELLREYPGKFVLIKGQEVIGAFDTIQEALAAGAQQFGLSEFLVRRTDEKRGICYFHGYARAGVRCAPVCSGDRACACV